MDLADRDGSDRAAGAIKIETRVDAGVKGGLE
jgi:hypothetical protein